MHHRVQRNHAAVGRFAHDLPMYLAARRHIHHQVALDARRAGKAVSGRQRPPPRKLLLGGAEGSQILRPRIDTVLGEVAFHHQDLAASAQCPAAAD
jgi:hypothetical protein